MENESQNSIVDEINMTRSLIDSVERQITTVDKALQDLSVTLAVVNEKSELSGKETRISIGSGMYVTATMDSSDRVIVPIGSEVFIESSVEEAKKKIEANLENLSGTLNGLMDRRSELRIRYDNLIAYAQAVTQGQQSS